MKTTHAPALAAVAAALLTAPTVDAALLYFENFDDPTATGNGNLVGLYGWQGHRGSNGAIAPLTATNNVPWGGNPLAASGSDSGAQLRVVGDAAAPSTPNRVFTFRQFATDILVWTEEFAPISLSDYTDLAVGWEHRNNDGAIRAAIRIDDGIDVRWFASGLFVSSTTVWDAENVFLDTATWFEFMFDGTPTTSASGAFDVTGPSVLLPTTGAITAAGLYMEHVAGGAMRFDDFQITGTPVPVQEDQAIVPEPAAAGMTLLGLGALGLRRRRA